MAAFPTILTFLVLAGPAWADEGGTPSSPSTPPAATQSQDPGGSEGAGSGAQPAQAAQTDPSTGGDNGASTSSSELPPSSEQQTAGTTEAPTAAAAESSVGPTAQSQQSGSEQQAQSPGSEEQQQSAAGADTESAPAGPNGSEQGGQNSGTANASANGDTNGGSSNGLNNPPANGLNNPPANGEASASADVSQNVDAGSSVTQNGASNGNVSTPAGPQDSGSVSQSNGAAAQATASASTTIDQRPGGDLPSAGTASGAPNGSQQASTNGSNPQASTTIAQTAGASASASQQNTGNSNVSVRADADGDDDSVTQQNTAAADSSAATAATATTTTDDSDAAAAAAGGGPSQQAAATANATQSGVGNSNVSVRVGSEGDNGPVAQSNTAAANAEAASDPPGNSTAAAGAAQNGVSNTNVSVRVFSPGDDDDVDQRNEANAYAGGEDEAVAEAQQDDARNTQVSIRVESSGTDGPVSQSSTASETASTSGASTNENLSVENSNGDTSVLIRVGGPQLPDPTPSSSGLVTVWTWNWNWWYDPAAGAALPVDGNASDWGWIWGEGAPPVDEGSVTTVSADSGVEVGSFGWAWNWQRPGDSSWNWNLNLALDCSCVWIWNWTWVWSEAAGGQPEPAGASAPAQAGAGGAAVAQQNLVSASAEASAGANVSQRSSRGDQAGTSFAGQIVEAAQSVEATAAAVQQDPLNLLVDSAGVQRNEVEAIATTGAELDAVQTIMQDGSGTAPVVQWAGQQLVALQVLAADADSRQEDAAQKGGSGSATVAAGAVSLALVSSHQDVLQDGASDGGLQEQWAAQLAAVDQAILGAAQAQQQGARGRATAVAASDATSESHVFQSAEQLAAGEAGLRGQRSAQLALVVQLALASAQTSDGVAGRPTGQASSDAVAQNALLVDQQIVQRLAGTGGIDIQESVQNTFVDQTAFAASTSSGGTAGRATVVNCATVGQSSGQGLNVPGTATVGDLSAFCAPPEAPLPSSSPPAAVDEAAAGGATAARPIVGSATTAAPMAAESDTNDLLRGRAGPLRPVRPNAARIWAPPRIPLLPGAVTPPTQRAVAGPVGGAGTYQVSAPTAPAPPSGPGSSDAGGGHQEPPLQWPPLGLLGEAGTASPFSAGGNGVAAAMAAFLLALLGGWLLVAGSAVRRPTPFALRPKTPG